MLTYTPCRAPLLLDLFSLGDPDNLPSDFISQPIICAMVVPGRRRSLKFNP